MKFYNGSVGASEKFTIIEEYTELDEATTIGNLRTIYNQNFKNFYAPGQSKNPPKVVYVDKAISTMASHCHLNRLQSAGSETDTFNVTQIMKLVYDETTSQAESYIGAIVYYPGDKLQYQMIPLQLLSITDKRLRDPTSYNEYGNPAYLDSEYQSYYSKLSDRVSYLCDKKYMTQGFDEDIPTTMASVYDSAQ